MKEQMPIEDCECLIRALTQYRLTIAALVQEAPSEFLFLERARIDDLLRGIRHREMNALELAIEARKAEEGQY